MRVHEYLDSIHRFRVLAPVAVQVRLLIFSEALSSNLAAEVLAVRFQDLHHRLVHSHDHRPHVGV